MPLLQLFRRHGFQVLIAGLVIACFCLYAQYRQRYIGAVDWYGYYQEGMLFKEGRTNLPTELYP